MNKEDIISRIREIKSERNAAIVSRDEVAQRLEAVKSLLLDVGEAPTLTKLTNMLKSLRDIAKDAAK